MSPALLVLETQDFAAASRRLRGWAGEPIEQRMTASVRVLDGCAGMAGGDRGGRGWAASYDEAVARVLRATADATAAVDQLALMFAQTARNYEDAEAASTAIERHLLVSAVDGLPRWSTCALVPIWAPSAAGGPGGEPTGWGLIASLVGYVWPNGHQDQLRMAAQAWRASATALRRGADQTISATALAISDDLPEAADMWQVCQSLAAHLGELAEAHGALASSCEGLAHHLDEVHSAVAGELVSLVEWTAGIEATGALVSIVTFGLAEAPAQGIESARVGATAARVAALIERFVTAARALTGPLGSVAERADRLAAEVVGLTGGRLTAALVEQVQLAPGVLRVYDALAVRRLGVVADELPAIAITSRQLQLKFKHAAAFGVTAQRSKHGFDAFEASIRRFVASPGTKTVRVSYRGQDVFATYDVERRLVVVRGLHNDFVSGWKMRRIQLLHLVRDRRLGGG
jgi:hypothetical protein